jgi:multiple sugar transport system permease protein
MSDATSSFLRGTQVRPTRGLSLRAIQVICVLMIALVIVSPLVLLLVGSLKDDRFQIIADLGTWRAFWVSNPSLNNFVELAGFSGPMGFGRFLVNSLIVLAGTVGLGLIVNSMAGFVLAWGSVPGRAVVLAIIIGLYIVPQESLVLPLLVTVVRLGLNDTLIAQIIPFIASPLYTFLFYQFFAQLPKELFEASQVDGASIFRTYWNVFLPLSLPAVATVTILMGLESWNQYLWPVLVSQSSETRPIAVAIGSFFGQSDKYWDHALAASVLMMGPILLVYLAFQRWFVSSFIGSAVKG